MDRFVNFLEKQFGLKVDAKPLLQSFSLDQLAQAYYAIAQSEAVQTLQAYVKPGMQDDALGPVVKARLQNGLQLLKTEQTGLLKDAYLLQASLRQQFAPRQNACEVWVWPSLPGEPLLELLQCPSKSAKFDARMLIANMADAPAISVPLTTECIETVGNDGFLFPNSVHLMSTRGTEDTLLDFASQLFRHASPE